MILAPYGNVISTRILRDGNGTSKCVGFARYFMCLFGYVIIPYLVTLLPYTAYMTTLISSFIS